MIFWWAEYSFPIPNKTKIFELKIEDNFCLEVFHSFENYVSLMFFEKEQLILPNCSFSTLFAHTPY